MEINVRDDRKLVEVWLTREEQQDIKIREGMELYITKGKTL